MKITQRQLRQIIQEEIQTLQEGYELSPDDLRAMSMLRGETSPAVKRLIAALVTQTIGSLSTNAAFEELRKRKKSSEFLQSFSEEFVKKFSA